MKQLTLITLGITLYTLSIFSQITNFEQGWKFKTGDDSTWKSPEYNDTNWAPIKVGEAWETQGFKYDGIAWYRKHVFISSKFKDGITKFGYSVQLGAIDDCDQAFFNGTKIGETGNFNNINESGYYNYRNYNIPITCIKWDSDNILSVRVNDFTGEGGFYRGNCSISHSTPDKIFSLNPILVNENGEHIAKFNFSNINTNLTGNIICNAYLFNSNKPISTVNKKISIEKGNLSLVSISINPNTNLPYYIIYTISINNYDHKYEAKLFMQSSQLTNFKWTSERLSYPDSMSIDEKAEIDIAPNVAARVNGDTYPCTWADNDIIYLSAGDPDYPWGKKPYGMQFEKIIGTPENYKVKRINTFNDFIGGGGTGPKPTGLIAVNNKFYLAVQNLKGGKTPRWGKHSQHGSDAHIYTSSDYGTTWLPEFKNMGEPMFPGCLFGGPAFVNCGKNNANAPDKFVYAVSTDQWDNGTDLRLGRVSADSIANKNAWQWVSGFDKSYTPQWTSVLEQSVPIFANERSIGSPEMVYIPEIKKYLFLTWKLKNDFNPITGTELFIFESDNVWGPFNLVYYEPLWEFANFTPYCPRVPLKWLKVEGNKLTGWILYSGSWTQNHIYYHPNLRKFEITFKK